MGTPKSLMSWTDNFGRTRRLDLSRCVFAPYDHQGRGLVQLMTKPRYGLFWEMRLGKTKAIIDAACFMKELDIIDAVLIACPAQVKDVWAHREIGEIKKHAFVPWNHVPLDGKTQDYADILAAATKDLLFMTISHELLRQEDAHGGFPRAYDVKRCMEGKRVWVVYDETAAFGNHKSLQTKAAMHLNKVVEPVRKTLLDGTPIGNSPIEQYSKFGLLEPSILGYKSFFHFRAVHQIATDNGFAKRGKAYVSFKNQDLIDRKVRGFCEYLEQKDCLDMPEKVQAYRAIAMPRKLWRTYCDFRDEMVAELECGTLTAQHASVKVLRLAQMCAGFVGGMEDPVTGELKAVELDDSTCADIVDWLELRYRENVGFKCVVWARWQPEIERLYQRIRSTKKFWTNTRVVYGKRKEYDGELHPDTEFDGPMVLVAQPQALRYGVNLSKADTEVFLSQDYNRVTRAQAIERIQAPNVRKSSLVVDYLVTGPDGQKTITWDIKSQLDNKEEVARRTAGEWKRVLLDE